MEVFAKSDIGKARDKNQDYFYIPKEEGDIDLLILADGMGGYNGGELASKIAVDSAKEYICNNYNPEVPREEILVLIKKAMEYANIKVYERAQEQEELEGMGTTLEICLINKNKVYIGHIGDSRVYRIRKQFMRRLTTDHSYVEELVKDGKITREEAWHHPKKNMLMKALGCEETIEPDVMVKGFLKGDILLISSDGLTNMIRENEIYDIVTQERINVDELIDKANDAGGLDNITVIVAKN